MDIHVNSKDSGQQVEVTFDGRVCVGIGQCQYFGVGTIRLNGINANVNAP